MRDRSHVGPVVGIVDGARPNVTQMLGGLVMREDDQQFIILSDKVGSEVVILGDGDVRLLIRYDTAF